MEQVVDLRGLTPNVETNKPVKPAVVRERTPFCGEVITPQNRNQMMQVFYHKFMDWLHQDEAFKDKPYEVKRARANFYARLECNREVKHYKAWLKGKTSFTYHGKLYQVLTETPEEEKARFLSDQLDLTEEE